MGVEELNQCPILQSAGKVTAGSGRNIPPSTPFNAPSYRVMQITGVRDLER